MKFDKNPLDREKEEPTEGGKSIPWSMMLTVGVLTLWGAGYLFSGVQQAAIAGVDVGRKAGVAEVSVVEVAVPAAPVPATTILTHNVLTLKKDPEQSVGGGGTAEVGGVAAGASIYASSCGGCHQASSAGLPGVFPPVLDSEWVIGEPRTLAPIVIGGCSGALTVNGAVYQGVMPPFGSQLDDKALADLLTYLRSDMNSVDGVNTDLIAEVRAQLPAAPFSDQSALQEF